ncbi:MAG: cobalt-precorrin-6A reductase [Cyanobacteria bacterium J06621_8]
MKPQIWLIGGTSDSKAIALALLAGQIPLVVTVTSRVTLYPSEVKVIVGKMDQALMESFCKQQAVAAIVDASHPYATEVSRQAILVATRLNIPYLRYERSSYQPSSIMAEQAKIIDLDSFETLLAGDYLTHHRVMLTVGCQILPQFQPWQGRATLYARVLPRLSSVEIALAAGFTSDRLIALRPPITMNLEMALWQQWQISLVVTKASGISGGEDIKQQAAAKLGIPIIVVQRPPVVYHRQTSSLSETLAYCRGIIAT